jgi:hypothetical protein
MKDWEEELREDLKLDGLNKDQIEEAIKEAKEVERDVKKGYNELQIEKYMRHGWSVHFPRDPLVHKDEEPFSYWEDTTKHEHVSDLPLCQGIVLCGSQDAQCGCEDKENESAPLPYNTHITGAHTLISEAAELFIVLPIIPYNNPLSLKYPKKSQPMWKGRSKSGEGGGRKV